MQMIPIKTVTGTKIRVGCPGDNSIEYLNYFAAHLLHLDFSKTKLVYKNMVLENHKHLSDYALNETTEVTLIISMSSGRKFY